MKIKVAFLVVAAFLMGASVQHVVSATLASAQINGANQPLYGTCVGESPTPVKGFVGNGFWFDGVDDTYLIKDTIPTQSMTVAVWVKMDQSSKDYAGIFTEVENGSLGFARSSRWFLQKHGNENSLDFGFSDGTSFQYITAPAPSYNEWHYLTGTFDNTSRSLKLYIDGEKVAERTTNTRPNPNPTAVARLGRQSHPNYSFKGVMDDLRLYNTVWSAEYVKTAYAYGRGFEEPIRITNDAEAATVRTQLTNYIWKDPNLPSTLPTSVRPVTNPTDLIPGLTNYQSVTAFDITLPREFTTTAHLIKANGVNNPVVIFQAGHEESHLEQQRIIQYFLDKGVDVVGLSMPWYGPSNRPFPCLDESCSQRITIGNNFPHNDIGRLSSSRFSPLRIFLEPVVITVNQLVVQGYTTIAMTGLSGGGWTTHLAAAADSRIDFSYPVAGSIPLNLREQFERGDWEQTEDTLYTYITGYKDLYTLAAAGTNRHQTKILIKDDDCCFATNNRELLFNAYVTEVQSAVSKLTAAGSFSLKTDTTVASHMFSRWALDTIWADLAPRVGR